MKLKVALVLMVSILFALGLTGIASAITQVQCDSLTFTHGTVQPGESDTVCGTITPNIAVSLTFDDDTQLGSSISNGTGEFCITFTVPTTATANFHGLFFSFLPAEASCTRDYIVYVVEPSVPAPPAEVPVPVAAPAAEVPVAATLPTTLPSTGFMLIPAGGLLAGGLGTLLFRKRRR